MKDITVSLLDAERQIHVTTHEGFADLALGALSAEPETIDELVAATHRFAESAVINFFMSHQEPGVANPRAGGEQFIIDLSARLMVNATTDANPPQIGSITRCDEHAIYDDMMLPYRFPDDWLQSRDLMNWQSISEERRANRRSSLDTDYRSILHGKVAEFIVREWQANSGKMRQPVSEIQDTWLLTARPDLNGQTPREILMRKRDYIDGDISDQAELWRLLDRQPPAISARSKAFRFGGFGSHEILFYHEMVTLLVSKYETHRKRSKQIDPVGDVRYLEQLQQEWSHQPADDLFNQSPAGLIARERSRLPVVMPKNTGHFDDDCPICQMMADEPGPAIWQMNDWHLNKKFSTSSCATLDEWEEEYGDWNWDEDPWANSPDNVADITVTPSIEPSVWDTTFTNMKAVQNLPPGEAIPVLVFAVAGHLAELGLDLQAEDDTGWLVPILQSQFGRLRGAVQDREVWGVNMAVAQFGEHLRIVGETRADLHAKCLDLEEKLDDLAARCIRHFGSGLEATS